MVHKWGKFKVNKLDRFCGPCIQEVFSHCRPPRSNGSQFFGRPGFPIWERTFFSFLFLLEFFGFSLFT